MSSKQSLGAAATRLPLRVSPTLLPPSGWHFVVHKVVHQAFSAPKGRLALQAPVSPKQSLGAATNRPPLRVSPTKAVIEQLAVRPTCRLPCLFAVVLDHPSWAAPHWRPYYH